MLFGALLAVPATMFVSCKDYDDDITEVRGEITTSATDLSSLVEEKMKNVIVTLQNRRKSVKSRYFAIGKVARRYVSKTQDSLFISSKKITENIIRFVLMWSLPVVFILSVVYIIYIRKEESLWEKERMIELQQRELYMLKREYSLNKTLDSLNMVRNIEALDTTTKK